MLYRVGGGGGAKIELIAHESNPKNDKYTCQKQMRKLVL